MSYITVKFGDGQQQVFNPHCRTVCLLQNIRDRCYMWLDDEDINTGDIELSDESGNIKFLRDTPYRYANEILHERDSFVLLRVDRLDASYTPLLKDDKTITEDFMSRLCVREDAGSRPVSSLRARASSRRSRSPAGDRDKDGRNSKQKDRARNNLLKPEGKPGSMPRSKSRQK